MRRITKGLSHPADELLDLVDEKDNVIGQKHRSEIYAKGLSNFRVINAFVVNKKGKLWIPRRSATKRIFPLHLDFSVGGHVESGETYEQALNREVREEINLNLETMNYRQIGYLTPHEHNVSAMMKVYEIKSDGPIDYNKQDFIEFFWLSTKELVARIKKGEKVKEDLPKVLDILHTLRTT